MRLSRYFGLAAILVFVFAVSLSAQTSQVGYAIVTPISGNPAGLVAAETLSTETGSGVVQTTLAPTPLLTSAAMAVNYGASASGSTGIAIVNPSSGQATVSLSLTNAQGVQVASRTIAIVPNGQLTQFLDEIFSGQILPTEGGRALLEISSNLPVGAVALNFGGIGFAALPLVSLSSPYSIPITTVPSTIGTTVAQPITEPIADTGIDAGVITVTPSANASIGGAGSMVFPQVVGGGGWTTNITIANTASLSQTVRIDFFSSSGAALGSVSSIVIASRGIYTFSSGANGIISGQ